MQRILGLTALALAIGAPVLAQRNQESTVRSPEVRPDGTVLFRLQAPKATAATVTGDFLPKPLPMEKDAEGVWTATAGPLEPAIYGYAFNVNGVKMPDPRNNMRQAGVNGVSSLVEVPGSAPMFYDAKPCPTVRFTCIGTTRNR